MMNFSHYNISRLQREARSLPAKIRSLVTVFLLRVGVVLVAMSVIIGSYSLYGGYLGIISTASHQHVIHSLGYSGIINFL